MVGFLQVWLLHGSLSATKKAASAAEKSAQAAQQAQAAVMQVESATRVGREVDVIMRNVGQGIAYVYAASFRVRTSRLYLSKRPPYGGHGREAVPIIVLPQGTVGRGRPIRDDEATPDPGEVNDPTYHRYTEPLSYVYGYLSYRDIFGRRFRLGFGIMLVDEKGKFFLLPNADFNYLREITVEEARAEDAESE